MNIKVSERLANYYLSSGQATKAIPLGQWLYNDYDPRDPEYGKIYVEGVLKGLKEATGEIDAKAISDARDIAGRNAAAVKDNAGQRDTFWMSYIQVFELSLAMKGHQAHGGRPVLPAEEQVDPARRPDPGAAAGRRSEGAPGARRARRRARGSLPARLRPPCRTSSRASASTTSRAGGKPVPVFVDVDAPAMQARVLFSPLDRCL